MRLLFVVILVVVLGGSLGVAHTWSEFSGVEERLELPAAVRVDEAGATASGTASPQPAHSAGTPRARVVGEPKNDFGILQRDASRSHSFVIHNDGDGDLHVEKQGVSCGMCVETSFASATVKPGEALTIPVTFRSRKPGPALNEHLEVRTNDEAHGVIRFDLIAYISEAAGASVSELAWGSISADKGGVTTFRVYGFADAPLEIVSCQLANHDNRDHFKWEIGDLSEEAVKAGQPHANFGKEIKVTITSGLPVGPLRQNLRIIARAGKLVTIDLPISGQVTGDLSLTGGSAFTPDTSVLSLGRTLASKGASAKLMLMVKGEHRESVQPTIGECDPAEYLSATVGERKSLRDGEAYMYPVTVEIPKNLPPLNRLGGVGSSFGRIIIHTTHPTDKEVTLFVRFAVE